MRNIYTDKEVILKYLDNKGLSKNSFYNKTGLSVGFLDKGSSLGVDKLKIILDNYHDFNPMWLLGDEEIDFSSSLKEPSTVYTSRTDRNEIEQMIPLYDLQASAGLVELFQHSKANVPVESLKIPNLPKCDGAVYVTGDSMYPLLKSGDIVIYKEIQDILNNIFWGEMYLISIDMDGEEYISVKFLQKSDLGDEFIKLVSQNSHHQAKDISLSKVRALAIVKASIRINSMG